jgi:hypothetical protein
VPAIGTYRASIERGPSDDDSVEASTGAAEVVGVGLGDALGVGIGVADVVDATGVAVSLVGEAQAATAPAPAEPSSPKISVRLRIVTILALKPVLSLRIAGVPHHSA